MTYIFISSETRGHSNRWGDTYFNRLSDSTGDAPLWWILEGNGRRTELYGYGYFDFSSQDTLHSSSLEDITASDPNRANRVNIWQGITGRKLKINVGQYEQIASGSSAGRHLYENVLLGEKDQIEGGRYNDTLYGYDGDDIIYGEGGNDLIVGGSGNDLMDGQAGEDTILLSGNSSEYSIEYKSNIRYQYTYNSSQNMKTGSFYFLSGPDGSADFFRNIEWLQFDDRRMNPEQLFTSYSSYSADKTRNYIMNVFGKNHSIHMAGDDNNQDIRPIPPSTMITVDYTYYGTNASDRLLGSQGANGESWAHDYFSSLDGDDFLGGGGGRDVMNAGLGDDELRGGYGHDILDGGKGEDILYGGGGRNTFNNNDDGDFDQLFILSDYHAHNYEWGRLHKGANADTINSLGEEDRITILGVATDELSIRQIDDGLGIFASGSLEAVVTDSSWNASSLGNNVFGDATRFW